MNTIKHEAPPLWREMNQDMLASMSSECDRCGSDHTRVLTVSFDDRLQDGDPIECGDCKHKGMISVVDGDAYCAWDDMEKCDWEDHPVDAAPAKFPVNPQRDENGNAVLYPGMTKFEGVAGLYNTEDGEVVILAPNFESLQAHVRRMGVSDEISRERCILSTWSRLASESTKPEGGL